MSLGIRCAETTPTSYGTPSPPSTSPAADMTGQSESDPITIPTSAPAPPTADTRPAPRCSCAPRPAAMSTGAPVGSPPTPPADSSVSSIGRPVGSFIDVASQMGGGAPGPVAQVVDVAAADRHVTDLPTGPQLLAVPVDLQRGVAGHAVAVGGIDVGRAAAQHVDHDGIRRPCGRRAQRQVEYRPQMILELAGHSTVDGPVAGVVGPHGQLIDQDPPVDGLEQLDGEDAYDVELHRDREGDALRFDGQVVGQPGRWGHDLDADAVTLDRLHDRVRHRLTGRGPGDDCRQLAAEGNELLREYRGTLSERLAPVGQGGPNPHALSVLAAPCGLQDHGHGQVRPVGGW